MYYSINKGLISFSKFNIIINNIDDIKEIHIPLRIKDNKIYCDTDDILTITKNILDNNNIQYIVEDVVIPEEIISKTKDIVYKSIDELRNHIENNIEPESVKKTRLEQENIDLKLRLQQTEDALLALMFGS